MRSMRTWATGWQASALGALLASATPLSAVAQDGSGESANPLLGAWTGAYECSQGVTGLTLTITRARPDDVRAIFHFYAAPENPGVPTGCFEMSGTVEAETGRVRLEGGRWLLRPRNYQVVDFLGRIAGARFEGRVDGYNCTTFQLARLPSPKPVPRECRPPPDAVALREAPADRDPG